MRLTITLGKRETEALLQLAASELRDPRDEVRHIVQRELRRRKVFPGTNPEAGREEVCNVWH